MHDTMHPSLQYLKEKFSSLKILCTLFTHLKLIHFTFLETTYLFTVSIILSFPEYTFRIRKYEFLKISCFFFFRLATVTWMGEGQIIPHSSCIPRSLEATFGTCFSRRFEDFVLDAMIENLAIW